MLKICLAMPKEIGERKSYCSVKMTLSCALPEERVFMKKTPPYMQNILFVCLFYGTYHFITLSVCTQDRKLYQNNT